MCFVDNIVWRLFVSDLQYLRFLLFCFCTASLLSIPISAIAEDPSVPEESSEALDAILMLDASGSMLLTDPQHLRNQGAKLFTRFLKEGDRLGIVEFSEGTKIIRPLSAFDPKQIDSVAKDIDRVGETGAYTDILAAVQKAKEIFEVNFRDKANQVVVLLSDGKFEPNPKLGSPDVLSQRLLEEIVPEARSLGIKFYTLAFSEQADRELLKEIAVGSGGINWYAKTPDEIHNSYADLFLVVKKPQLVPLTKAGFQIDEDIREATFYINRQGNISASLMTPDGTVISQETKNPSVKWFGGENFDVVTVSKPIPGNWQISGISAPDGFATVLTNLKLVTDWPPSINAGEKVLLQVRLYDSQKPVILPEMTGVVQYAFFVTPTDRISEPVARGQLYDDGTHGDKVAGDAIFSSEVLIPQVGDYKLRVIARGPTFERNQQMTFRAKPPFIALSIYHKEAESQAMRTILEMQEQKKGEAKKKTKAPEDPNAYKDRDIIRAQLSDDAKAFKSISVNLIVTNEQKQEMILPMKATAQNPFVYEMDEFALPQAGKYQIKAVVLASGKKGETAQEMTAPVEYVKKASQEGEVPEKVVFVEERKAPAAPSHMIPILIMTLMNCVAGVGVFMLLRKFQAGAAETMPVFTPLSTFSLSVEALRKRSQDTEIDLSDPRFAGAAPQVILEQGASDAVEGEAEEALQDREKAPSVGVPEEGAGKASTDIADIDSELTELLDTAAPDDEEQNPESSEPGKEKEGSS